MYQHPRLRSGRLLRLERQHALREHGNCELQKVLLRHLPFLFILAFILMGCETNQTGSLDVDLTVPFLTNATITPDSVYIDSQIPINGRYTITTLARVRAVGSTRELSVQLSLIRTQGLETVASLTLRDDGVAPDQVAGDSIYTGEIRFSIERSQAGRYRARFEATSASGARSNAIELPLKIGRRNAAPALHSVSVPDSVNLPTTDTLLVQFTATVSDSDGLGDIREVAFRRISPPDPTKFFMKDDGGLDPPVEIGPPGAGIRVRSGDDVAGDGRYSFLIPVTPSAARRTNVFLFQAVDSFGDTSRSIIDSLIVR